MRLERRKNASSKSFDRQKKPPRQNIFLLPLIWLCCRVILWLQGFRLNKINTKGLKPPFLVYATHHAFMDFYVTPIALFPFRANYISELDGFIGMEWLYRQVGCLCKRKFTTDISLIRNIEHVVHHSRDVMVIYPEARYCNIGTSSPLPESVGKMAKHLGVPVVVLNMRGNYLNSPIWNLRSRHVRLEADLTQVLSAQEVAKLDVAAINTVISKAFCYDEYAWQQQAEIDVRVPWRAEGLHRPLYQCPACGTKYKMAGSGSTLSCNACGKAWHMTTRGQLKATQGETEFPHIPHWYEWQRQNVATAIASGQYSIDVPVRVEALPNAAGFELLGEGHVRHSAGGYHFYFRENGEDRHLHFKPYSMPSVHTEYDYRSKKGECFTLSTLDNTYFLYPQITDFNVTELQFATEELYRLAYADKQARRSKLKAN